MKGILFKPDMHKAIREGRKTITRRVIKPQPPDDARLISACGAQSLEIDGEFQSLPKPRYQVGEVVYIKEAWRIESFMDGEPLLFGYKDGQTMEENSYSDAPNYESWHERICTQSTEDAEKACKLGLVRQDESGYYRWDTGKTPCRWRSPLFMPAWAARDFIQITGVRAERLQEISPGELCTTELEREGIPYKNRFGIDFTTRLERYVLLEDFKKLWDSINKEHPWVSNPWVWRYEFKRVEKPTGLRGSNAEN